MMVPTWNGSTWVYRGRSMPVSAMVSWWKSATPMMRDACRAANTAWWTRPGPPVPSKRRLAASATRCRSAHVAPHLAT